jgi:hypothetical protein
MVARGIDLHVRLQQERNARRLAAESALGAVVQHSTWYATLSIVPLIMGLNSPVGPRTSRFNGARSRMAARALRLHIDAGALPSLFIAS